MVLFINISYFQMIHYNTIIGGANFNVNYLQSFAMFFNINSNQIYKQRKGRKQNVKSKYTEVHLNKIMITDRDKNSKKKKNMSWKCGIVGCVCNYLQIIVLGNKMCNNTTVENKRYIIILE